MQGRRAVARAAAALLEPPRALVRGQSSSLSSSGAGLVHHLHHRALASLAGADLPNP
jgi:hypothetical protein